jgi:hypothetical protein
MTTHLITAAIDFKENDSSYSTQFKHLFLPRQKAYADHHGMIYTSLFTWPHNYISKEDYFKLHSAPIWLEMVIMWKKLEEVPDGDVVIWIDADIAPLKGKRDLGDIKKNIAVAFDQPGGGFFKGPFLGPNLGLVSARACEFTRDFFKRSFLRTDCEPWPFSSNMGTNLTIGEYPRQVVLDNFEELPRTMNVTLDQYKAGVKEEDIEFKHFAGKEKLDTKYFIKPVQF